MALHRRISRWLATIAGTPEGNSIRLESAAWCAAGTPARAGAAARPALSSPALRIPAIEARRAAVHDDDGAGVALAAEGGAGGEAAFRGVRRRGAVGHGGRGSYPEGALLCGKCNTKAMIQMDGCMTCLSCGESQCG
jgi:hypothetical protein